MRWPAWSRVSWNSLTTLGQSFRREAFCGTNPKLGTPEACFCRTNWAMWREHLAVLRNEAHLRKGTRNEVGQGRFCETNSAASVAAPPFAKRSQLPKRI